MKYQWTLTGLACPNCALKLSSLIEQIEGIESAKINFLAEKITVETTLPEDGAKALCEKVGKEYEAGVEIE